MLILPHLFCFCTAILGTVPFINIPALLYVTENRWLEKNQLHINYLFGRIIPHGKVLLISEGLGYGEDM